MNNEVELLVELRLIKSEKRKIEALRADSEFGYEGCGIFGIAVAKDELAKEWQTLNNRVYDIFKLLRIDGV